MPLPEITDFEEALCGIRLSAGKPAEGTPAVRLPLLVAADETGKFTQESLWLLYRTDTKITFERLLDRISRELNAVCHPKQGEFALLALAFASLASGYQSSRTARLNKTFELVCDADANLYYLFGAEIPEYVQYEIPPFRIGRLRTDKLRYNCEKAGSDFYDRYKQLLRKACTVERTTKRVRVIELPRLHQMIFSDLPSESSNAHWRARAWAALVNAYFSMHNRILFDAFWSELESAQDALLSLGAPLSDFTTMRSVIQNMQVAVFMNIGERRLGFVAPAGSAPIALELANVHRLVPALLQELKKEYCFEQFDNSALHGSIKLFAAFVGRARRHQLNDHSEEALIHFVIALELIFGVRTTIQKSVAERVSLITFREAGCAFEKHRKWIDHIYDLRSRYVHGGERLADASVLLELYVLCQQVFRCLLRLQAAHRGMEDRGEHILTQWLADIDYLAKGVIAGKTMDDDEFRQAFIT